MYFTYIIECVDGTLYTGVAQDIEKRLLEHKAKIGAKYTRSHIYKDIKALWVSLDRSTAQKLEYRIKKLSRHKKIMLIEENSNFSVFISDLDAELYIRKI